MQPDRCSNSTPPLRVVSKRPPYGADGAAIGRRWRAPPPAAARWTYASFCRYGRWAGQALPPAVASGGWRCNNHNHRRICTYVLLRKSACCDLHNSAKRRIRIRTTDRIGDVPVLLAECHGKYGTAANRGSLHRRRAVLQWQGDVGHMGGN